MLTNKMCSTLKKNSLFHNNKNSIDNVHLFKFFSKKIKLFLNISIDKLL